MNKINYIENKIKSILIVKNNKTIEIMYYPNGRLNFLLHKKDDYYHNNTRPAYCIFFNNKNNSISSLSYYKNGLSFCVNNTISEIIFYKNNKIHTFNREDELGFIKSKSIPYMVCFSKHKPYNISFLNTYYEYDHNTQDNILEYQDFYAGGVLESKKFFKNGNPFNYNNKYFYIKYNNSKNNQKIIKYEYFINYNKSIVYKNDKELIKKLKLLNIE